jgi:tRNA 2-thiouridine synthesizing protein A
MSQRFESEPFDESTEVESAPLRELQRLVGGDCRDCRVRYSARDGLFSIALGFKNAPRCLECLSRNLDRDPVELQKQLLDYIHRRDCYRQAWEAMVQPTESDSDIDHPPVYADSAISAPEMPTSFWDAGDMACGELVLALRLRLNALPPGARIMVRSTDAAAPEDLPAWCRMCGHTLESQSHPQYVIRRKGG